LSISKFSSIVIGVETLGSSAFCVSPKANFGGSV
jgi:hypothetical protein